MENVSDVLSTNSRLTKRYHFEVAERHAYYTTEISFLTCLAPIPGVEVFQKATPSYRSSFSYEDLSSNFAGTEFGKIVRDSKIDLSDAFSEYMLEIGAKNPAEAPNFDSISEKSNIRVDKSNLSSDPRHVNNDVW